MVQLYRRKGADILVNTQTTNHQSAADVAVLPGGGYVVTWADSSGIGGDSSGAGIKAQRFDSDGNKLGGEFLVNATVQAHQFGPTIAALGSGRFVVTWGDDSATGGDTSSEAVRGQLFESDGTRVGGEFLINTQTHSYQVNTRVTGLAGGGFAVTWVDGSGVGADSHSTGIKAQLFDSWGAKVGGEFLVNTTILGTQQHSSLAALPSGGFVAAWASSAFFGDFGSARLQMFDAFGAKVGAEVVVNGTNSRSFSRTDIAALADGFVVTWAQQDPNATSGYLDFDVRAQRFDFNGAKVGGEFIVHAAIPGNQGDPDVHALPGGGFIITWRAGQGNFPPDVYGQIFDAAGVRVGVEFVLGSVAEGIQTGPRVAVMPSGDIVVVWSDESLTGGDSSGFAVRSQILTASGAGPNDIALSAMSLNENAIENVAVATLSTSGVVNSPITYQIVADSTGGAFRIDGDRLVVDDNARLDFETAPQATLTIRATDLNGQTYDEVVVLDVTDIVQEKRFSAGGEMLVNVNQSGYQGGPTVVALTGGGFAMFWEEIAVPGNSTTQPTLMRLYTSAGEPRSGEIRIADDFVPGMTVEPLADGGFVITREALDSSTNMFSIKAQRYDSDGQAVGAEMVAGNFPNDYSRPVLVQLDTGGFIIAWGDQQPGTTHAQRFDSSGIAVGAEFTLRYQFSSTPLTLVATPNGGFAASWIAQEGRPGEGRVQFFDSGNAPVGGLTVGLGWDPGYLTLLALSGGGYMLAWRALHSVDGFVTLQAVMGQPIDANGAAIGNPVQLASYVDPYNNNSVSFSALPDGGFVAISLMLPKGKCT